MLVKCNGLHGWRSKEIDGGVVKLTIIGTGRNRAQGMVASTPQSPAQAGLRSTADQPDSRAGTHLPFHALAARELRPKNPFSITGADCCTDITHYLSTFVAHVVFYK